MRNRININNFVEYNENRLARVYVRHTYIILNIYLIKINNSIQFKILDILN